MKQDFLDWVADCTIALVFILILLAASVGPKRKK